jgi:PAS domain S-box-containing protein
MARKRRVISKDIIRPLFQEYLDVVPIGITARDINFNVIYANETYASARGVKLEDCIGRKCYELFKMPFCGTERCDLVRVVKEGKPIFDEVDYRRPDGRVYSIKACFAPLKDENNNIIGEIIFETDVTEVKEKERELNNTMSLCAEVTEKIVKKGDLFARVDINRLKGRHKIIGTNINQMIDSLQSNIEELRQALGSYSKVLNEVALGRLTARVNTERLKGKYKLLGEVLNSTISILEYDTTELKRSEAELNNTLSLCGDVLDKVTQKGDLSARINLDKLAGKYKIIGEAINYMVTSLQKMSEEVKKHKQS